MVQQESRSAEAGVGEPVRSPTEAHATAITSLYPPIKLNPSAQLPPSRLKQPTAIRTALSNKNSTERSKPLSNQLADVVMSGVDGEPVCSPSSLPQNPGRHAWPEHMKDTYADTIKYCICPDSMSGSKTNGVCRGIRGTIKENCDMTHICPVFRAWLLHDGPECPNGHEHDADGFRRKVVHIAPNA